MCKEGNITACKEGNTTMSEEWNTNVYKLINASVCKEENATVSKEGNTRHPSPFINLLQYLREVTKVERNLQPGFMSHRIK